ncbi:MAG: large conductance mechanosensitive channel protein MscL [Tenericutes bacterium HGW-Tenericutes-6]|jgi:large conductance mechanosensitive channel|nr:MAG: large conductance mechanosensitive channel protein MscL [Tenericutes bacterium HGW-Tenericutes-6]
MSKKLKTDKKAKVFFSGFKVFITRGNIIDLAIAVIIGGAFGRIISSLVNDIIMPLITTLTGRANFTDLIWIVNGAEVRYGQFIQNIVEFLIISFSIYFVVTLVIKREQFRKKVEELENPKEEAPKPVVIPEDVKLLTEIRDELKSLNKTKKI